MQELTIRARMIVLNKLMGILAERASFLYSAAHDRRGRFGLDKVGSVWYIDHTTGMMIYPFGDGPWRGWTGTDAQREIVSMLALFIKDAAPLDADRLIDLLADGEAKTEMLMLVEGARN